MVALFPDAILDALLTEGPNEEHIITEEEFHSNYDSPELYKFAEYSPCDENENQFTFAFCIDAKQNKFYVLSSRSCLATESSQYGNTDYFISVFDNVKKASGIIKKAYIEEAARLISEFFNTRDDNDDEVQDYIHALKIHSLAVEYKENNNNLVNMEEDDLCKIMYSEDEGLLYLFINGINLVNGNKKCFYMISLAEAYFILQDINYFLFGYND
jgi:hypothetical protein